MKTKFFLAFLISLFTCLMGQGQNLVPNPSFEDTVYCPEHIDSIDACAGWHSGWQPTTSPNYFNICSSNPQVSPPDDVWGYQQPHTGNAFCYLLTYFNIIPPNRRETIQARLNQSLTVGQKYFVSFYANFPGIGANNTATDKLGALFTTFLFTPTNYAFPHNFAQVYSNTIITDTLNWTHVTGSFVADSSYQYITLGNFFDDANTDTIRMFSGGYYSGGYLIDDICVSSDSLGCEPLTGIKENSWQQGMTIFPNPASTQLSIQTNGTGIEQINIYNTTGSLVLSALGSSILNGQLSIDHLPSGVYIAEIKTKEGSARKRWVKM